MAHGVSASEPAERAKVGNEMKRIVADNHEPGGQPDGHALVVAGFGTVSPRIIAGRNPVFHPHQLANQFASDR